MMETPFTIKNTLLFIAMLTLTSCELKVFNMTTPAMESTIPTDSKILLNYDEEVQRNDIIAFKVPSDLGTFFVFRMIAQPGDTLRVTKGEVFINGHKQNYPETIQYRFLIDADVTIRDEFFQENGINEYLTLPYGYVVNTTAAHADKLKEVDFIKSVSRMVYEADYTEHEIFKDFSGWNKDNIGNLYLPKQGDIIAGKDLARYSNTILKHEDVNIEGKEEYQFKKSYCFVMGDSRDNAFDSRYIGLIPMDKVMGTVEAL